ncbi:uncharacterized protein LOC144768551 [Lissotriton helveticus]
MPRSNNYKGSGPGIATWPYPRPYTSIHGPAFRPGYGHFGGAAIVETETETIGVDNNKDGRCAIETEGICSPVDAIVFRGVGAIEAEESYRPRQGAEGGQGRRAVEPTTKKAVDSKSKKAVDPKSGKGVEQKTGTPKPAVKAADPKPSTSAAKDGGRSAPSASFTKQVSDSLKRIRDKASASEPKTPSTPKQAVPTPKTSTPILFTLRRRPSHHGPYHSVVSKPTHPDGSLKHRPPLLEEQSELFIDADTGKLTLYKRKITASQPLESFTIPLKRKRPAPESPVLVEPIVPQIPGLATPSPTYSDGEDAGEQDEEYNSPANTEPDEQQDSWVEAGDQGDQHTVHDPQVYNVKTSPTEDSAAFNALIERAAKNHDVEMHADPVEVDFLFDTFSTAVKTLPMLKGVLKHAADIFKEPTRSRVVNPRIEKKYRPAPGDPTYIKGLLPLDSLVFSNARKRANSQTTGEAPPPDKKSKVLEASGKRVAAQAANIWRISNTQALLARYDRAHYDTLETLLQHLPDQYKEAGEMLIQEGKLISNASIKCALDVADTAARAINTSVMLRRQAWLRISGFKPEIQTTILNQPVNPDRLFGPEVDTTLEKIKNDTETAKSMGALQSQQFRGSTFRRSGNRGVSRGQMSQQTQFNKGGAQSSYTKQSRGGYRGNSTKGRGRGNNNSCSSATNKQ